MATFKAANPTLYTASPPEAAPVGLSGGHVRTIIDTFLTTDATLDTTDNVIMARLPVQAFLKSVKFAFDDFGTTGDFNIGFAVGNSSGTVLDVDAIAVDVDVNAAATVLTEYRFSALNINTARQPVWDLATLTEIPDYDFIDIIVTPSEITTGVGDMTCIIEYTL